MASPVPPSEKTFVLQAVPPEKKKGIRRVPVEKEQRMLQEIQKRWEQVQRQLDQMEQQMDPRMPQRGFDYKAIYMLAEQQAISRLAKQLQIAEQRVLPQPKAHPWIKAKAKPLKLLTQCEEGIKQFCFQLQWDLPIRTEDVLHFLETVRQVNRQFFGRSLRSLFDPEQWDLHLQTLDEQADSIIGEDGRTALKKIVDAKAIDQCINAFILRFEIRPEMFRFSFCDDVEEMQEAAENQWIYAEEQLALAISMEDREGKLRLIDHAIYGMVLALAMQAVIYDISILYLQCPQDEKKPVFANRKQEEIVQNLADQLEWVQKTSLGPRLTVPELYNILEPLIECQRILNWYTFQMSLGSAEDLDAKDVRIFASTVHNLDTHLTLLCEYNLFSEMKQEVVEAWTPIFTYYQTLEKNEPLSSAALSPVSETMRKLIELAPFEKAIEKAIMEDHLPIALLSSPDNDPDMPALLVQETSPFTPRASSSSMQRPRSNSSGAAYLMPVAEQEDFTTIASI